MTFYERYINGETETVYQDVLALGQEAFLPERFVDIDKLLTETFQRVKYNLEVIYRELNNISYCFKIDPKNNFEKALHVPLAETDTLLEKIRYGCTKIRLCSFIIKIFL